ncbi:WXG100-like domain-containing protein [Nocardia pseudovaccinii]|uniref:WXG100-like domain-containing protein n=1 Tax=Nocardia pseudovaccinii TaxID=189540 RepID=UPI0007A4065E|nr:hypothetical protein [Nocardia pseudovaccinii]
MGLYLPPELAWLGWVAGGAWPEGDETDVWHVSDAYKTASGSLRKQLPDIEDVKRVASSAYPEGAGGDRIGALFDQMLTGDQSVESLAKYMEQISDAVYDYGTQIEAAKLMTIVSLIALAIEIAWAWMFPPTAAAVEAAETAATRFILRRLELWLQERILAKVLSVFGEKFANLSKGWVMKILEGAFIAGGLDAAVQVGQIASGHRKHFDWTEFGAAASTGLGAPFGRSAANSLNKFTTKAFGNKLENPWVRAGNGALVGIGSSPVFGAFGGLGAALVTGDWAGTLGNPAGWVGGAAQGGIVGGVRGYRGGRRFDNSSFEVNWKMPGDGSVNVPVRGGHSFDPGGLGPHGSRNGFGGEHIMPQNEPGGTNGPRGGNGNSSDNSYSPGGRSGSSGGHQDSLATHPASFTGDNYSERSAAPPPSKIPQHEAESGPDSSNSSTSNSSTNSSGKNDSGSNNSSASNSGKYDSGSNNSSASNSGKNDSGSSKQSPPVAANNVNGSQSGGSSNSGQHGSLSGNESKSGGSVGGSNGGSHSSSGSSTAGGGRSESLASSNPSENGGSSSNSNGASRTSPSTNLPGDGRNSSTISGPSDRPTGGPAVTRPSPGGDGSVQLDRSPTSQPPKGGIQMPSRPSTPDTNIVAGQSQRGPASASEANSAGSSQPPRSPAVSDVSSSGSGQSPRSSAVSDVSSTASGQPPRRPVDLNPGGAPPQRPPVSDSGSSSPNPPRSAVPNPNSGDETPSGRRPQMPTSDSGHTPPRQRPPESTSGGLPPLRPRPEGDLPPSRGSVPQEHHSDPGGRRGHDAAGPGGARTFEGDREHRNWTRSESGDILITSPDGTEHWVDKHRNIFIGRPDDPTLLRIGPDRSVEFLPNNGNRPVAEPGPQAGPGREGEFGFGRDDGTRHTVLDDGSVRTESPDGSTTIVGRDGGADLRSPRDERTRFDPDGTAVHTRPGDPTTVTTPDNTVHVVPNDKAGRTRDEDGNLVVTSPDGTRHVIGDDGTIVVGRTGDPQLMKVGPEYSIVFVGPDGTGPAARSEATVGKGSGVQSPAFTRPDRVSHTVLGDGSVRTKSPDDWTTTVRPNGAAEFTSPTGDKIVYKADDTVVESGPGKPTVITGPDQTKQTTEPNGAVTVEDPDGTEHVVFDSTDLEGGGRTRHPDQTVIHHDLNDTLNVGSRDRLGGLGQDGPRKPGVVQMDRPDGTGFESSPKGIKVFDDDGTVYERGSRGSVRITAPNGHTESRSMKEPIELSNGAQLERTRDGFRVVHEDDSVSEIGPRGVRFTDGDGVVRGTRTDGTAFVNQPDGGPVREVRGDGAVRVTAGDKTSWGTRGDGTTWTVDGKNKVHVSDPDGTVAPPADPKNPYVDGADLTAKIKPRHLSDNDPLPGGYRAPTAPETDIWIPPGYEKVPPEHFLRDPSDHDPDYWGPPDYDPDDWDPQDKANWGPPDRDRDDWDPQDRYDRDRPNRDPYDNDQGPEGLGRHGGSDDGGGGSGHDGGSGRAPNSLGGSRDSSSGPSGEGGSSSSERNSPPENRQPPPAPRLDPAMLKRMLQNLHAADGMAPPPGESDRVTPGGGSDREGELSPDFSSFGLGDGLRPPTSEQTGGAGPGSQNGVSGPPPKLTPPGGEGGPRRPDLSALRGALDKLASDRLAGRGDDGSGQQGAPDQPGSPKHPGAGERPGASHDPAAQNRPGAPEQPGAPGRGGQSDRPDASNNSNRQQSPGQPGDSRAPGGESNSGAPGGGDHSGAPKSGDPSHAPVSEDDPGAPAAGDQRDGLGAGEQRDPSGTGEHQGEPGVGRPPDTPGAGAHPGIPGDGNRQDGSGTGSHSGAPGNPDHSSEPGQPKATEQPGNSSQPGGSGTQHPSMPGKPPAAPMPDGHQPTGSSSPGGAPPPGAAPPAAPPGAATGPKKPPRRDRKKDDKPRKNPKSMLMPSPFEAPALRAGPDDSAADVPFALEAANAESEPDSTARSSTKTTRSTTDG